MMDSNSPQIRSLADRLGIAAAAACALHCVALPVLLLVGASVPAFLGESFHRAMLLLIVPSALVAFTLGCWRHRDRYVVLLGVVGVIGIVISGLFLHDILGETGEKVATLISAAVLIAGHVRNFRLCRADTCD
ncbi:MAG: MerC domain-containing protein [Acidobacteriota bacterium]